MNWIYVCLCGGRERVGRGGWFNTKSCILHRLSSMSYESCIWIVPAFLINFLLSNHDVLYQTYIQLIWIIGDLFNALMSSILQERRNLRFMQELRLLFGLMIGSTRKYVDPSKAVDILKEAFSSPSGVTDSQQV